MAFTSGVTQQLRNSLGGLHSLKVQGAAGPEVPFIVLSRTRIVNATTAYAATSLVEQTSPYQFVEIVAENIPSGGAIAVECFFN